MYKLKCNLDQVQPITKRGDEVRVLISPTTVNATQLIMGKAKLPAGKSVAPHVHDYSEECFFVLSGNGIVDLNGEQQIEFGPGDAVLIPKGVKHSVQNIGAETMEIIFASAPLAPKSVQGHRDITGDK